MTIFGRHIYCSSEMKRYAVVEAYNELPHSGKMDNSAVYYCVLFIPSDDCSLNDQRD